MNRIVITLILLASVVLPSLHSQTSSYFDSKFIKKEYTHRGNKYTLYEFSREGTVMRAKYFAQNAYTQYQNWKNGKEIMLVTAGAFSDSWDEDATPVGLCVDNGKIVTKSVDRKMDGMVIIYNGGAQIGGIAIVDLDLNPVRVDSSGYRRSYYVRSSNLDPEKFLSWGEKHNVTLFQTQLVYSSERNDHFSNLNLLHGRKQERRFLAICKKNGYVHHVVVDAPTPMYLNLSAKYTKEVLDNNGFDVLYILNLDTGDKNVLHVYNGFYLQDLKPRVHEQAKLENATNLLVFYKD